MRVLLRDVKVTTDTERIINGKRTVAQLVQRNREVTLYVTPGRDGVPEVAQEASRGTNKRGRLFLPTEIFHRWWWGALNHYREDSDEGWKCDMIQVRGPNLLKSGEPGQLVFNHAYAWEVQDWHDQRYRDAHAKPAWLGALINRYDPTLLGWPQPVSEEAPNGN